MKSVSERRKDQYPAMLTEQARSIKDLLYGPKKNFLRDQRVKSRTGKIV